MKPSPSNPEEEEQRLSEINARAFPSSLATSSTINGNSATHQDLIDRRRQRNNDSTRPIENLGNGASELQLNQEREKPKIPSKLVDPCQAARKVSITTARKINLLCIISSPEIIPFLEPTCPRTSHRKRRKL
ncbi:hypothetical protein Pst134EA_004708 [Puccinia striiformis f. sp. tritici]|uniref:hypothetical protein n=1 Tax=Puccinia striiformis f. sp. tritici TaxID=168172 RepID=UPI002007F02A|nr:hypothetical protein Pst134EA_004708 [Puccinia striiformis f. sp. tritici]KAH9470787.1 hypothetical protein Pst134EA_004708 [Puccinia striiformis f. sp. tritici]